MVSINEFNQKYNSKGGIKTLTNFRENYDTLLTISKHFKVSKERVRQWMKEMFKGYDPRTERREAKIKTIIDLIKRLGEKEVRKMGFNKQYFKIAIKRLKK